MNKDHLATYDKNPILKYLKLFLIAAVPIFFLVFLENFFYCFALIIQRHEYLHGYGFFNVNIKFIDNEIPKTDVFFKSVYMYVTWIFIPSGFLCYFFIYGQKQFYRIVINWILLCVIFFILWIIFPTFAYGSFHDKPEHPNPKNDYIHYCAWPSGHAFFATFVLISMLFNYQKTKKWWYIFSCLSFFSILILLSTLFTKQHYIFDPFITMFIIAIAIYVFRILSKKYSLNWFDNFMFKINSYLSIQNKTIVKTNKKTLFFSYLLLIVYILFTIAWLILFLNVFLKYFK